MCPRRSHSFFRPIKWLRVGLQTQLYGCREALIPLISDSQCALAFGLLNPWLHLLVAWHLVLSKKLLTWRDLRFRPYARGAPHPAAKTVVPLLSLSPLAIVVSSAPLPLVPSSRRVRVGL